MFALGLRHDFDDVSALDTFAGHDRGVGQALVLVSADAEHADLRREMVPGTELIWLSKGSTAIVRGGVIPGPNGTNARCAEQAASASALPAAMVVRFHVMNMPTPRLTAHARGGRGL